MKLLNYIIILTLFMFFSCGDKTNNSKKLYGKWKIIDNIYHPKKISFKDKNQEVFFEKELQKLNHTLKNSQGKYIIFNKDSTFYSEDQPKNKSYWSLINNNQIIFSKSKKPFIQIYTFEKIEIKNDTLILFDYQKEGDFIKMKLQKWQK